MKLTKEEGNAYWDFAMALKLEAYILDCVIREKLPKKVNFPILNNHIKRIKDSADAIKKEAAYSVTVTNDDLSHDQAYALYRIQDILRFANTDELYTICEDLQRQSEEIEKIGQATDVVVHKQLMAKLYNMDAKGKERLLKLAIKIERENQKKMEVVCEQ